MKRAFEDFNPGDVLPLAARSVSPQEIATFASDYGVLEPAAVAGRWHATALFMRMAFDGWLGASECLGSPGLERLDWPAPIRANAHLSGTSTVLDRRPLKSRPTMGLVRFRHEVRDAAGATVVVMDNPILIGRREAGTAPDPTQTAARPAQPAASDEALLPHALGSHHFSAASIKRFAAAYDPQTFHLDEAAAAATHFGGLSASGWHTATIHHRLLAAAPSARALGQGAVRDLKWSRPVIAGDTLSYFCATAGPAGGERHWATNQSGEIVFSYRGE